MDDADAAAVTPMAFEDLPYECIVECFVGLSAADLAAVSQVSMLLKEAAAQTSCGEIYVLQAATGSS